MRVAGADSLRACIIPLLDSLGSGGGAETALRGLETGEIRSIPDLLNAMASLGFANRTARVPLSALDKASLPCLAEFADREYRVLLRRDGDSLLAFDGAECRYRRIPAGPARARVWRFASTQAAEGSGATADWLGSAVGKIRRYIVIGSIFSLALGGLSLLYPVLMTAMYGKLASTSDARFVLSLALGAALYLMAETGLRFLRGALLDYSSARFGQMIGAETFRRLLSFQASFTESAPLDSQIRRIRDFETISGFVSGPAFAAIFDLPFIVLNIAWLAAAGPRFLIAPFAAFVFFAVGAAALQPGVKKAQIAYAVADGVRHDLFARIVAASSRLSGTAARASWTERFGAASRSAAVAGYDLQRINGSISALSSMAVSLGGLATLYFGVLDTIAGKARPDALVAAMLLVWRVLEPARSAFVVYTQLDAVRKSVEQARRFLALPLELPSLVPRAAGRGPEGDLAFHEVFFRYGAEGYPALVNVGFVAPRGSIFMIEGHAGSGKTTVAKLTLGLYRPQAGRITLGGQNIQQVEPALLRRSVAYAPKSGPLFPGSIRATLRLGAPEATDRTLEGVAESLLLTEALAARGLSLDSELGPREIGELPSEIAKLVTIGRALARKAGILVVDEPETGIHDASARALVSILAQRRQDGDTVIVLTNDRDFAALSDAGLRLDAGRPTQWIPAIKGRQA